MKDFIRRVKKEYPSATIFVEKKLDDMLYVEFLYLSHRHVAVGYESSLQVNFYKYEEGKYIL